jgi:nucleoid DNA-binding protein
MDLAPRHKGLAGVPLPAEGVSNMTKKDIVLKVSDETGIKQIDVKKVVQKTFDCIVEALVRGEKIELRNFGVFKVKQRKSRTGRNPRTNQVIPVPPRKVVVFKSGLAMKQQIR